jgi:rSAM/selenodomain-associated transferase 2
MKFSIIIPVYHEQGLINSCLLELAKLQRITEAEVIVSDGGGGTTLSVIENSPRPFKLMLMISPMGRGVQQNRGVDEASAEILIFLHVDTQMPINGLSLIEDALERYKAGVFSLKIDSPRRLLHFGYRWANFRSRVFKIPYGDQVIFMRKKVFIQIGKFQEIPVMEDVALMLDLRKRDIDICVLDESVLTSDRRWRKEGLMRRTVRNWKLYTLYRIGVPPERLSKRYRPQNE